jgi:hypothetical protein
MSIARARALALSLLCAGALSGAAAGANVPGTVYVDKPAGFRITIPKTWQLVPRSVPQVKQLVATLQKKSATAALAAAYASIIATAAGRTQVDSYTFQAFDWPFLLGGTPILTEAYVFIVKTPRAYGKKDLTAIGDEFANALSATKGSKIVVPREVDLPAGPAEYIIGTIPAGVVSTGIEWYLIPHGKAVYELGFQIDSSGLATAKLFTSIAQNFRFV